MSLTGIRLVLVSVSLSLYLSVSHSAGLSLPLNACTLSIHTHSQAHTLLTCWLRQSCQRLSPIASCGRCASFPSSDFTLLLTRSLTHNHGRPAAEAAAATTNLNASQLSALSPELAPPPQHQPIVEQVELSK